MPKRSILDEEDNTEINLSPMIDCIFILLIFFIVTTVFVEEKGLQADKPDVAAAASFEESENVTLEITAESKVLYDGQEVNLAEIAGLVKAGVSDPETPVTIRAHEKASHGVFVAVWDAARRGGAVALSFNTVN
ncbi:MAG: biopolymer transporter ExbD [Myxococcota bacterium]